MSNFNANARNPKTGKVEDAEFLDDFYGKHIYGVRFSDGCVYREDELPDDVGAYTQKPPQSERVWWS